MKQRVNLVDHLDLALPDAVNIKLAARLCSAAAVLALFYYGVVHLQVSSMENHLADMEENQQVLEVELNATKSQLQSLQNGKQLLPQIELLKKEKLAKSRILDSVAEQPSNTSNGFSAYLKALGERPAQGLWFTRLWFEDNGRKISWSGHTQEPASVPRYLQQLKTNEVYTGHFFSVLKMQRGKDSGNLLAFEISSTEAEK